MIKAPNLRNINKYLPQARKPQNKTLGMLVFFVLLAIIIGFVILVSEEAPNIKIGGLSRGGDYETLAKDHPRGQEFLKRVNEGYDHLENDESSDDQQAYLDIAFYKNELGDREGSVHAYLEGLKYYPTTELFLSNLAHVYENVKDYKNAELYYKKTFELNPNNVRIILDLAQLYRFYMPEREGEILPFVEVQGLRNNPNDPNLLIFLAEYYRYTVGNRGKAVEYYQKVIAVRPDDSALQKELKNLLSQ